MVLTLTEDIIFQSELDKQDIDQISEKKFQNLTDFDLKILQRVRFSTKIFTTRLILMKKRFFKKHDFEENNIFKKHDFDEKFIFKKHDFKEKNILTKQILKKKFAHKKSRFDSFYTVKCANFVFYVQFWKAQFWGKKILNSMILNKKFFLKSMILNKKFLWKTCFSIKFFSSCQILN